VPNQPVAVAPLDPHDDAEWADYHRVTVDAQLHERPYGDVPSADAFRVSFVRASQSSRTLGWTARLDGAVVGAAMAVLPMADNTHLAFTEVNVTPSARRRGVGSALLAGLDDGLRAAGRHTDLAEVSRPYAVDVGDGPVAAGVGFARASGYELAQTEVHFVLQSPLDLDLLNRLQAEVDAQIGDYRVVSWQDRCPDEWVEQACALEEAFIAQAPMGEMDVEPERWSEQRLREKEEVRLSRGQHGLTSVAVAPDGSLAGNTELVLSDATMRGGVFQSGTLVLPSHRGHRLGLALKIANHRQLEAVEPAPRLVHTFSAEENTPMIAVNTLLGFRPVELSDEWQRRTASG